MRTEYDGIVIGAGHNGMICCGYLAKAGLKMLVVERHLEMGGGLDSHEGARSGYWHNVHSNNHRGVSDLMWYRDLGLGGLGQEYIRLPVSVALLTRDHRAIVWYADEPERTAASIGKFSVKDAKTFLQVNKTYASMARDVFFREIYSPPVPFDEKRKILEQSEAGRQYLKWQPYSIIGAVSELFENDTVRGMIAFLSVIRGYEVDSKGLGMVVPAAIASGVNTQMAKGTTHKMAHTLHKLLAKEGVDIVESNAVERILMEGDRVAGIRTVDGREFKARFVISSVNPHQTFLDFVGRHHLDDGFAKKVEHFKYSNTTPLFTLHLALNERLYWKAAEYDPDVDKAFYLICGLEGLRDIETLYRECNERRIPSGLQLLGAQPAQHDPSQAPEGKCTAFFWQVAPGNLSEAEGGWQQWDRIRRSYSERCVRHLEHYTTNLTRQNIVDQFGLTPVDIQRHLPNMVGGDIQVGELSESQIYDRRPLPECSQYRTPVQGLYLCGSSTHPGGNITGAPGYNAAGIVCKDLGIPIWWNPVDVRTHWAGLAAQQ